MIITISGIPGSGKSTLAKALAKKLCLKQIGIGQLRRAMAGKMGMTLEAFNTYSESHPDSDQKVDAYQKEFGEKNDNFIMEGRLSWYFIPHSIKIYVTADLRAAAQRIYFSVKKGKREKEGASFESVDQIEKSLRDRIASDRKRYSALYKVDPYDPARYDLVIDTTRISPPKTVAIALRYLAKQGLELPKKVCNTVNTRRSPLPRKHLIR